jgi:hypothetical protein
VQLRAYLLGVRRCGQEGITREEADDFIADRNDLAHRRE